jgi:hypothetical protein
MATGGVTLRRVSLCFTVIVPEMVAAKRHAEDVTAATAIGNNTRNAARRRTERRGTRNPTLSVIGKKGENSRANAGLFRSPAIGHKGSNLKPTTSTLVRIQLEIALTLVN